jgi:CRISPR type III-A-associated protein Csm2
VAGNRNYNSKNYNSRNYNDERKKIPNEYWTDLKNGYYVIQDGKPVLKKDYIVTYPSAIAQALSEEGRNINKRTQIRKYYEYALRIQEAMNYRNGNFAEIEADFNRLIPHVSYAQSRSVVSPSFVKFIQKNVEQVHTANDLRAFIKHFEAVVAYLPKDA